jgi:hypothetical protein
MVCNRNGNPVRSVSARRTSGTVLRPVDLCQSRAGLERVKANLG